jgi:hypothetical protein
MREPVLAYANVTNANVTKTGKELGIVAIVSGAGWYETAGVARMPVARFIDAVLAGSAAPDAGRH